MSQLPSQPPAPRRPRQRRWRSCSNADSERWSFPREKYERKERVGGSAAEGEGHRRSKLGKRREGKTLHTGILQNLISSSSQSMGILNQIYSCDER